MSDENLNFLSDEQLVKFTLAGNQDAFAILYLRYRGLLMNYYLKKLENPSIAEDLVHKVFLKLLGKLDKFDQTKIFKPWFFTVAYNELMDHFRNESLSTVTLTDYQKQTEILQDTDNSTDIADIINTIKNHPELKENQKLALELRYIDELSFESVGKKLKTSPQNVRQIISRALKILKGGNKNE